MPRTRRQLRLLAAAALLALPGIARAEDVSARPILQLFEASWQTMERRAPDIFMAGYGGLWTPPPGRAEQGNLSVGYDQYDRFDLGSSGNGTLYGTETGLKTAVSEMHKIGVSVYTDLVWNHNGFADLDTAGFVQAGGYPGFVVTRNDDVDGDFHGKFDSGDFYGRTSNLIDIAQEKTHQYIRNPVPGFGNNLPAGSASAYGKIANVATEANRRFYPDVQGPSTTINNVTYHQWNTADPSTGDPVSENATGYLMRNARWMVEVIGVDGFRLDATKHMVDLSDNNPDWVLEFYDQAVNGAIKTPLLDGSQKRVFAFGEFLDAQTALVQQSIKKDANANRDALDFALHYALKNDLHNLIDGNNYNSWHDIVNTTQDIQDDQLANNGSQSVAFDASHDDAGADLGNVANAYLLMRPGNAIVYMNAKEFGTGRAFPKDGRGDALGGFYGNTVAKLVEIRNSHGRGNYNERWIDQRTLVYERDRSMIVGLSNDFDGGYDERTVQTSFPQGTRLLELTGNATDISVDPAQFDDLKEVLTVGANGMLTMRIPRNQNPSGGQHRKGYVIYGLASPTGTMAVTNVASTIAGETATAANNGTVRLTSIDVIKANSFQLQLDTQPVLLNDGVTQGGFHDVHADGDAAMFRFDGGMNLNGNGGVDVTAPGDISYGFENFVTKSSPLFGGGDGEFRQTIDTTQLSEGYHYITARAYRHRNPDTGGDGGPAIYTDFRKVVYVDRLRPVSAVDRLQTYSGGGAADRDIVIRSTDKTATKASLWFNQGAGAVTTDQLVTSAWAGGNAASNYDRDLFKYGVQGIINGNQAYTIVTFETTYDSALGYAGGGVNVQRIVGQMFMGGNGLGLGDIDGNNAYNTSDPPAFESALASNNTSFNPAADLNADGLVDEADDVLYIPWLIFKGNASNSGVVAGAADVRRHRALALDGTLNVPSGTLDVSGTLIPSTPLTFTNTFTILNGRTITKTGGQTLNIASQSHQLNATLITAEGITNTTSDGGNNLTITTTGAGSQTNFSTNQHLKALNVDNGGVASITNNAITAATANGGRVIVTKSLGITGGKVNLKNNNMVVDYTGDSVIGSWTGSSYDGVTGQIATGRAGGAWNGATGIVSSAGSTNSLITLGVAEATEVLNFNGGPNAVFQGQTVDQGAVLVKYTYTGDATLDGKINGDDYFRIDANKGMSGGLVSYAKGDFDFNGIIDGDDYFLIDRGYSKQGAVLSSSGVPDLAGTQAVPEPAGTAVILAALIAAGRSRRRIPNSIGRLPR